MPKKNPHTPADNPAAASSVAPARAARAAHASAASARVAPAARQPRAGAKFPDAADLLRRDIVRGVWKPGERLPTWDALCERLSVPRPTLRLALSILKDEGFIEAAPTRATHVHPAPPHLTRYAMLFPSSPLRHGPTGWNLYWDALAANAPLVAKELGIRIDTHYDVAPHPDCAAYTSVMADHGKRRLAGVIVVLGGELGDLVSTNASQSPVVHICSNDVPADNAPSVWFDWTRFHERAADILISRKRRDIAVLSDSVAAAQDAVAVLAARGARTKPKWTLAIPGYLPDYARNLARLLVAERSARPDALLVTDDNLVPAVCEGIAAEGLSIPGDILVLGHCNWPADAAAGANAAAASAANASASAADAAAAAGPAAVLRLGFSARDAINAALKLCSEPVRARRSSAPFPSIALEPTA